MSYPLESSTDNRLRRALAAQRLSPLEAARSGEADIGDIARLALAFGPGPRGAPRRSRNGRTARKVVPRARGCEVCRAPTVAEGLCQLCRERMVLPLVDAAAAKEAAVAYRIERASRMAEAREDAKRQSESHGSGRASAKGDKPGPRYRVERSQEGWLVLRRVDGAGYVIRPSGRGFIMTEWINAPDASNGKRRRYLVEEFLRDVPELMASPGCQEAVRALASCDV